MLNRVHILVRGIVQGVGFRPFVFSEAHRRSLKGHVLNNQQGVLIDVEGESNAIEQFIAEIESNPPPLSTVEAVELTSDPSPANYTDFRILDSRRDSDPFVPVSADAATCKDCLSEMFDPLDRRYRYPFINCTNCGPRFTIVEDVPYDRTRTSMREFKMCQDCRNEYEDPLNRRFHAEPIACAACGPGLVLTDAQGRELHFDRGGKDDAISRVLDFLIDGEIVAIKGLGGFHLACDATNPTAVDRLRARKYREEKPFAMMARTVDVVSRYCSVSAAEEDLLRSRQSPIVLLQKRHENDLAESVAPGVNTFGFLLPYTPLHHLLLASLDTPLVMTSGNVSDEPICYRDQDAWQRLNGIADYFLVHNRRVHMRADDSVARLFSGRKMVLRRSRGYAPAPIHTSFEFKRNILACGAELKNTFCLARGCHAFVSHHIGDLENLETFESFKNGINYFEKLFDIHPEAIAYDLHPEYLSTKYALSLSDDLVKLGVQHHHAHIASCMADNRIDGEVIGIAMDGLGFGADGRFWGGEFFVTTFREAHRVSHLDYIPMPGGTKAIREPWRIAAVYLHRALGDDFLRLQLPYVQELDHRRWTSLRRMITTRTNSPEVSSVGRLFDAVASLLRVRDHVNYEGQAAIGLEQIADRECTTRYEFGLAEDGSVVYAEPVIRKIVEDLVEGVPSGVVSAKFHLGIAGLIADLARKIREEHRLNRVAMSGGVFQNVFLLEKTCGMLKRDGFEVYSHSRVPANDGGISLGQAAIANAQLAGRRN
jgi:hydrogenase maturation protein HypF